MREGWTYKKLGEVCNIDYGTRVVRSRDGGTIYPVYGGGGATFKMDSYNREDCMVISRFAMSEQCTRFVKGKFFLNDSGLTLSLKNKELNQEFLNWNILSLNNTIYSLGRGTAQKNLDTKAFAEITISYPVELSEQKAIVSRLDSAFAHIDALKANAEKQLSDAKALFQKALEKAMEPKEGWEEKKLKDIVDEDCPISYGIVQQGDHIENGIPVVRPVDLDKKIIRREKLKCTTNDISNSYKRTILKGNEILLSVRGTTGVIALAAPELKGCNVNRGIVPLSFNGKVDKMFIYYEMLSPELQTIFAEKTTGSTLKQINIKDLRLIEFSFPPFSEQQRIVDQLDQLSEKVKKLQEIQDKTIKECDALKQAILREVFE